MMLPIFSQGQDGVMSKYIIVRISTLFIIGIIITAVWIFLKMLFIESINYTERDWLAYHFYTPELFKKIPRVSGNYEFTFNNITEADDHLFTMRYYGVTDVSVIRNYLKSEGYVPQKFCDIEAECWKKKDYIDMITVATHHSEKEVLVGILREYSMISLNLVTDCKQSREDLFSGDGKRLPHDKLFVITKREKCRTGY